MSGPFLTEDQERVQQGATVLQRLDTIYMLLEHPTAGIPSETGVTQAQIDTYKAALEVEKTQKHVEIMNLLVQVVGKDPMIAYLESLPD